MLRVNCGQSVRICHRLGPLSSVTCAYGLVPILELLSDLSVELFDIVELSRGDHPDAVSHLIDYALEYSSMVCLDKPEDGDDPFIWVHLICFEF